MQGSVQKWDELDPGRMESFRKTKLETHSKSLEIFKAALNMEIS